MVSDPQLHFTDMLVSPLFAISFLKCYILKAQTTKHTVRKYQQTINITKAMSGI